MRVGTLLLLGLTVCADCNRDALTLKGNVPEVGACTRDIGLRAWAAQEVDADGSVVVFGTADAPAGVTVQSMYAAGVPVPRTDFNYRSWSVRVSGDQIRAVARSGQAVLSVVAFVSDGCADLPSGITVVVPASDAGAGEAATDEDASIDVVTERPKDSGADAGTS